jgi:hypothetical protein
MAPELHIELLLGRRVAGADGEPVGRIEEVCAEPAGPDLAITEYHLGVDAALERLSASSMSLLVLGRGRRRGYRVPWDKLDLSDPEHPRLICPVAELAPLEPR